MSLNQTTDRSYASKVTDSDFNIREQKLFHFYPVQNVD